MKQKFTKLALFLVASAVALAPVVSPSNALAQASIDPEFNPNELISDTQFSNKNAFSSAGEIQKFLESKGSVLANTSADFLPLLKESQSTSLKQTLEDPNPNAGKLRSAAELIWDVSQSSGINPQVILVTLNKEQGLITGNFSSERLPRALDFAMGFGCPDYQACGEIYRGFYHQLFGGLDQEGSRYLGSAKSLMRSFTTPGGRGPFYNGGAAKTGDTIVLGNTLGGYAGVQAQQTITIRNNATAALYRYTPHVFNGNYNFFRFFKEWFGVSNGSLLKVKGDKNLYVVENGTLYTAVPWVAKLRGMSSAAARSVSSKEIKRYASRKNYGPPDNSLVVVGSKKYVFINNKMHPVSDFVISQRGLDPKTATVISESEAKPFGKGDALTPSNGSVIRGQKNFAVYLVEDNALKLFTPETFKQYDAGRILQIVPDSEIDSYPKNGLVSTKAAALMKTLTDPTVYLVENGVKYGLTADLFSNRGLSFKDIKVVGEAELKNFPSGGLAIPKDNTAIKSSTNPTVFYILEGQVRPMTYTAFTNRKIDPTKILVFSQKELDTYPKGSILSE